MRDIPLIGIAAPGSGYGKTRLILALLDEFARRGLMVAVLKHAHHINWPEDKDSSLYMRHGAASALLVAPACWLLSAASPEGLDFEAALGMLSQSTADLVLVEGYKQGPQPKLLLTEESIDEGMLLPHTAALVSDARQHLPLPCFSCLDTAGIADFIMSYCGVGGK
jgi:molybdopterin-guanine dinucleotide biosynthesis protein MobB